MINIIPIIIDERGSVKKDIQILAMENENISKRFSILLPNSIIDKWLYIEFEKADGTKSVTERIEAVGNYLNYDITDQLTMKGKLICQVVAKDGDNLKWKSNKFDFTIPSSINATEEVAASNSDILTDLQKQIDNIPTGGSSSIPVIAVEGSNITLEPNKHYVISGVSNSLTISLSEAISSELKHYSFEFTSIDRIPTVTINGVDQPYLHEYERYTRYLCEIVNNHLVILGTYDGYEYQFVYGSYATSDWTESYNLKNDRTFTYVGTETKSGTYTVEYSDGSNQYSIYLTFEDESLKTAYWADNGTITIDGVVYTKS